MGVSERGYVIFGRLLLWCVFYCLLENFVSVVYTVIYYLSMILFWRERTCEITD